MARSEPKTSLAASIDAARKTSARATQRVETASDLILRLQARAQRMRARADRNDAAGKGKRSDK
jgi:hypothetical protein